MSLQKNKRIFNLTLKFAVLYSIATLAIASLAHAEVAWAPPTDTSIPGQYVGEPQVVVDPQGNVTVVWPRQAGLITGLKDVIQSRSKPAGGSWDENVVDVSDIDKNASEPQIAVDADGNVSAIWRIKDGSNRIIQTKSKPAGGSWDATATNLATSSEGVPSVHIAANDKGDVTAVWSIDNGSEYIIQSKSKPAGGNWDAAAADLSAPGQSAKDPQVAVDSMGNATALWRVDTGTNDFIQAKSKPVGGSWEANATDLTTTSKNSKHPPDLAYNKQGDVTAVWHRFDGSNYIIQAKSKPSGGNWDAIATDLSAPGKDSYTPQVAYDPQSNATVVWSGIFGIKRDILSRSMPAGGSWDVEPTNLSKVEQDLYTFHAAYIPQLAVDTQGNMTAVWYHNNDGSIITIESNSKSAGGNWDAKATTVSTNDKIAYAPRVAVDANNNAVAAWRADYDGSKTIIQSSERRFIHGDPPPPPGKCKVPKLVGQKFKLGKTKKSKRKAIKRFKKRMSKKLKKSGCSLGKIKRKKLKKTQSKKAKRKRSRVHVIAQSKKAGGNYEDGAKIDLTISLGRLK